jgi:general secretion pathway protein A
MFNKFYGFSGKPFEVNHDPKFLYLTPSHQKALDSMIDGIKNRRGFISITGEVGTGKTTLIYSLLENLDKNVKTVYIVNSTVTFKELLKTVLLELSLGILEESEPAFLFRLAKHLTRLVSDETIAIIIDEAQNLAEDVIRRLQAFSELESKVIQVLLVGQPELEDTLNSQGLGPFKQRMIVKCQIRALTGEESLDYIDHRLKLVGSSSSQMFTPKAISMICSYAQGIPRLINILCDNAFLKGYRLSRKKIDGDIIAEVTKGINGPNLGGKAFLSSLTTGLTKIRPSLIRPQNPQYGVYRTNWHS